MNSIQQPIRMRTLEASLVCLVATKAGRHCEIVPCGSNTPRLHTLGGRNNPIPSTNSQSAARPLVCDLAVDVVHTHAPAKLVCTVALPGSEKWRALTFDPLCALRAGHYNDTDILLIVMTYLPNPLTPLFQPWPWAPFPPRSLSSVWLYLFCSCKSVPFPCVYCCFSDIPCLGFQ